MTIIYRNVYPVCKAIRLRVRGSDLRICSNTLTYSTLRTADCTAFANFTTVPHISFRHFFAQRGVLKAMIMNGIETKCLHYPPRRSALQLHSGRFPHFSFSPVICSGRCSHLGHSLPRINQVLDDFHGHHFIYGPFLLSLPNVALERPYHHLFMKSSAEKEVVMT